MNTPTSDQADEANADQDRELLAWAEANKDGFEALDELVEREGFPLEKYRRF
jgi:post-segregation antitoxin (ccd killing protein)